jgi:cysteine desulfurase/selenocysteine lyase
VKTVAKAGIGTALPRGNPFSSEAAGSPVGNAFDPVDPASWRSQFPALGQKIGGFPVAYLDTAATSLRPRPVIDSLASFYSGPNANPGATLHTLARRAAELYDGARLEIARFIGASDPLEIVFTRGTTEAINVVAMAWGSANLKHGDEILLTAAEHASNMLPWQLAAERTGAVVRYSAITDDGHVDIERFSRLLSPRTRLAAFSYVSNVVGIVNPVREMCRRVRAAGAITLVDAAQSAPHFGVNVQDIGCDFLAFSSHKMCGPMGAGVLWGRRELLDAMPPYQSGSNMAHDVGLDSRHYSDGALKFGAGTPNVADAIGFAAAARFLTTIGWDALQAHEQSITRQMLDGLGRIPGIHLLGSRKATEKIGVFAFTVDGRQPLDVVAALDARGIAVRAGDLAALSLLKRLGTTTAVRASCYLYTTAEEVDRLLNELERISYR